MNNIFNFATSELSQDAVIAWCLNWINENPSSKLYPLALTLLARMGISGDEAKNGIMIEQQYKHIDVLVSIKNCNKVIIIEDKVYTTEHDDQIAKYKEEITKLSKDEKDNLGINDDVSISTVYLKTGYWYDYDKMVQATEKIDGEEFYGLLTPFIGISEILDSYIIYLKESIDWYKKHGDFTNISDLRNHTICQHNLMRRLFPEKLWDGSSNLYKVYSGTNNGGTPWTEMVVYEGLFPKKEPYSVFWRVDCDNLGPYISLRFYDKYNKNDEYEKATHLDEYERLRCIINNVIDAGKFSFEKSEVIPGFRGNYYEAEIFCWHIEGILNDWENKGNDFVHDLDLFSNEFVKQVNMQRPKYSKLAHEWNIE